VKNPSKRSMERSSGPLRAPAFFERSWFSVLPFFVRILTISGLETDLHSERDPVHTGSSSAGRHAKLLNVVLKHGMRGRNNV
jgi:hypothetical protein